jgi:RNA polymerase sigma-70 factor (ECF subfamily)
MLANDAEAEDAVQEVFLRVARHLDQAPTSVEALLWIHRIASNYCLNELRAGKRHSQPQGDSMDDVGDGSNDDVFANRDLARRIAERAPERLTTAAWLHHVDGMSHVEVGRALGLSRRTVINYLNDFRERALKFLARER